MLTALRVDGARSIVVAVCALLLTSCQMAATGLAPVEPGKVAIEHVPPTDPKHEAVCKMLREHQVLENMRMLLSPFRLRFSITLRVKDCHDDYQRIKYAVDTLIRPHRDMTKSKQVRAYFEKKFATLDAKPPGK